MRRISRLLCLLPLVGSGSCAVNDPVGVLGPQAGYCARPGPAWLVDEAGRESCGGRLAARSFQRALCVCGAASFGAPFTTSTEGASGAHEASVEVRGLFSANARTEIDGALQVDSPEGLQVGTFLSVAGTLHSQGRLSDSDKNAAVSVGGDAWVARDIALGSLTVGGLLHQPAGQLLDVAEPFPESKLQPVPVPPPAPTCSCAAPEPIADVVARNAPLHHNGVIGLMMGELENVPAGETRARELPCGRFALDGITGEGSVRLSVTGRAQVFVAGDVTARNLEVRLVEGAELELFIAGSLGVEGPGRLVLDAGARPSRLRVYVGGGLRLPREHLLEAHLSASNALLSMSDNLELSGSLNVAALSQSGTFALRYDPEVRALAEACSDGG